MTARLNTFNRVAPFYDALKRVAFGKAIDKSQACFLDRLPPDGNLLILGGGSGEILRLSRQFNSGCRIWYVEASSRMLSMAAERVPPDEWASVTFIHGTEKSIPAGTRFDAVITNFFLDLFPDDKLVSICRMIHSMLQPQGTWLISDFVDGGKWWQKVLLKSMYSFFSTTCGIEATVLPSWEKQVLLAGMAEKDCKLFYGAFIKSGLYIKDL